jgi:hypothetical protein
MKFAQIREVLEYVSALCESSEFGLRFLSSEPVHINKTHMGVRDGRWALTQQGSGNSGWASFYQFALVHHPTNSVVGRLEGYHHKRTGHFDVDVVKLTGEVPRKGYYDNRKIGKVDPWTQRHGGRLGVGNVRSLLRALQTHFKSENLPITTIGTTARISGVRGAQALRGKRLLTDISPMKLRPVAEELIEAYLLNS